MKIAPFTVTGKGDSLWCSSHDTKGIEFKLDKASLNDLDGEPYELCLYGPKTEWFHYTDSGIENQVSKKMVPWLKKQYPDHNITKVCWSEQGMQPDKGWSFDIIVKD